MSQRELSSARRVSSVPTMNRRVSLLLVAGLVSGCHDTTATSSESPRLLSVSGSTFPVLQPGDTVVVEGSGFGSAQGNGSVMFGGTVATVTAWSDNQVLAIVPAGVTSGTLAVVPDTGLAVGPIPVLVRAAV